MSTSQVVVGASVKFRKLGNDRYSAAGVDGINLGLKRDRLRDAFNLYRKVALYGLIVGVRLLAGMLFRRVK